MNSLMELCTIEIHTRDAQNMMQILLMQDQDVIEVLSLHTSQALFTEGIGSLHVRRRCANLHACVGS